MELSIRTPKDISLDLAKRAKKIRKRKGYTQQQLAVRSNVSYGTVKKFERTGQIALTSLIKIAMELDLTDQIDALFSGVAYKNIQEVLLDAENA